MNISNHPIRTLSNGILVCAKKRPRVRRTTTLVHGGLYAMLALLALCLLFLDSSVVRADDTAEEESQQRQPKRTNRVDELRQHLKVDYDETQLEGDPSAAASYVVSRMGQSLQERISGLFEEAVTPECRAKIAEHFGYFVTAIGKEQSLPFTDVTFPNDCGEEVYEDWQNLPEGMHIGHIQNRTYQPPRNESEYIDDPKDLKLLYGILTHDNPNATIRLVDALHENDEGGAESVFVIHVDAKEKHQDTQIRLLEYAATRDYVHILDDNHRVRVNWGGFTMVNATMQILRYAFAVGYPDKEPLDFHKFIHLSSSSYPLASNVEIRHRLASYPLDANFLHIIMRPTRAGNYVWQYFVECDDALHRIYQLPPLKGATAGADLFTSSQWFIISRDFAWYLAEAAEGSFVDQYLRYIEHVVVADETFFGTVLRHTPFCKKHHNNNFLHVQFDRWENEVEMERRNKKKCPMPDPDHCGRSPTTMTLDYADIMELSDNLFARKFDDSIDTRVKDVVDQWRSDRTQAIRNGMNPDDAVKMKQVDFEGHGVLIVARDTVNDDMPLCLAIGETGNLIELLPCFEDWVPKTLADDWETGAVVLEETVPHTRWSIGPCTSDGQLERIPNGEMKVTLGNYSATGPRCMLQQMDGVRAGRCFDGGSQTWQPGGQTQVYPCVREWFQFVSFGDGRVAPKGSMYSTIPSHIVKQMRYKGHEQIQQMCLGVYERGKEDELDWEDEEYEANKAERVAERAARQKDEDEQWEDLSEWAGSSIITTQCTNVGAVIEWVFVPFIEEEGKEAENPTESADSKSFVGAADEL